MARSKGGPGAGGGKPAPPTAAAIGVAVKAVTEVVDALKAIPTAVTKFVEAFDPGLVSQLNAVFETLSATIGFGLAPIIEAMTEALQLFTSGLAAVMTELKPIIQEVSQLFLEVLRPVIAAIGTGLMALVEVIKSLMPVIRVLMAVFEGLAGTLNVVVTIFGTILAALFGGIGDLTDTVDAVKRAFISFAV